MKKSPKRKKHFLVIKHLGARISGVFNFFTASDRLPSSIKLQNEPGCAARFWILVFGISLDPGCWSLDLPWTLDLGAGSFCAYSVFMTVLDAIQRSTDFLAR